MKASGILLGLAVLVSGAPAFAYCRTSHCPETGQDSQVCAPAQADDCGFVVWWPKPRITYSVQLDASTQVPLETIRATAKTAFQVWSSVDCGEGQHPRFEVVETEPVTCREHEYNKDHGNANIILFHDGVWPYGDHDGRLALTTVSYNVETGEIYDADMELNSAHAQFTTVDPVNIDLLAVVTHEAGHFLGLAHSVDGNATMYRAYDPGTTDQRDLEEDDRAAICAVHPPAPITADCDPTPRHGFSPLCGADQTGSVEDPPAEESCCCGDGYDCENGICTEAQGCCTIAPGSGRQSSGPAGVLAALGALLLLARRPSRWGASP